MSLISSFVSTLMRVFTGRALLPGFDSPRPATIEVSIQTGKITAIHRERRERDAYPGIEDVNWLDAGNKFILPGLVEYVDIWIFDYFTYRPDHSAHVHLNEPGRTDWEGFWTGTRAAASGGVTTVVDMPLNSIPPTTTVENLNLKRASADGQCWTDVAFWGGVIPGNEVRGFPCESRSSGMSNRSLDTLETTRRSWSQGVQMFHDRERG